MRTRHSALRLLTAIAVIGAMTAPLTTSSAEASAARKSPVKVVDGETQPIYSFANAIYQVVNIETPLDTDGDGQRDTVQMRLKRPAEAAAAGLKVATIIEPSPYYTTKTKSAGAYHESFLDEDATPPTDSDEDGAKGGNGKLGAGKSGETAVPEDVQRMLDDRDADKAGGEQAIRNGDVTPAKANPGKVPAGDKVGRSAGPPQATIDETAVSTAPAEVGQFETPIDNYFVPRGYAVADVDSIGTGESTGCPSIYGPDEAAGIKAAIDWLNGRARGWDPDGNLVTARSWSNGDAALKGKSYDGSLPIHTAATGVEGLKTVVTIAGIPSAYEWLRSNGAVTGSAWTPGYGMDNLARYVYTRDNQDICREKIEQLGVDEDRVTGDYNAFWDERNYLKKVHKMRASVFVMQGMVDPTVKPITEIKLWEALKERDIPRKLWVFHGEHLRPISLRPAEYLRQIHHWYDHWLYGVENGIMQEPKVDVLHADMKTWSTQKDWPSKETDDVKLFLNPNRTDGRSGVLEPTAGDEVIQTMTDNARNYTNSTADITPVANLWRADSNRIAYLSPELTEDLRVQGQVAVDIQAALDGSSPYLTAMLVDYYNGKPFRVYTGQSGTPTYDESKIHCAGEATTEDPGCWYEYNLYSTTRYAWIAQRGWMDARNRYGIDHTTPIIDGKFYNFTWKTQPTEYTFPKGHRLAIVLVSTDYKYNLRYPAGSVLSVKTGISSVSIPVTGGEAAWKAATGA